jgi:2-C-methyl-D-erythritol 4-phosphate cytidylyltransferase
VKKFCIIVAGGSGKRMRSVIPKQFLELAGRPLLMHTVERFHSFDSSISIILVLPGEHHALWKSLCDEHSFAVTHTVVAGGEERFHSVVAGLAAVQRVREAPAGGQPVAGDGRWEHKRPAGIDTPAAAAAIADASGAGITGAAEHEAGGEVLIAIHDGVRPLVSHDTIWRCFADAEEFGNAVPFVEPADSVRVLDGDDSRPVPRGEVRLIQTPQVFRGSVIINAYRREYDVSFTDDATVAEASGVQIHLTHGNRENLKITTPEDLAVAETLAGLIRQ